MPVSETPRSRTERHNRSPMDARTIEDYREMMADPVRMEGYRAAIQQVSITAYMADW